MYLEVRFDERCRTDDDDGVTFFDGDRKLGEFYHGRGVQARWAGVNGTPPLIHAGSKLSVHFISQDKGKCDKVFGYSFVVSAVFDERDVPVEEQRFAGLGSSIKRELKRVAFKSISDATDFSAEFVSENPPSIHKLFFAQILSESWNYDEALTCLRHLYSPLANGAAHEFFAQTLCQVPLNYETDVFKTLLNHHSTLVPQLHLSSLRSFGACISENLQSFIANPVKESQTAFAMSQEVFRSGLHEFSVLFDEIEGSRSASCTGTNSFGIGVASCAALDLNSEGVFFLSSVGEIKRMGNQTKPFESCLPPCIGHPIYVTLDLTVPKISIRQFGSVLIEQYLPPSIVSGGLCALFIIESSDDLNVSNCRATIEQNHRQNSNFFQYAHFLGSIVSHKLFSDILSAAPQHEQLQSVISSNIQHFERMCGLVLKQIPESDSKKRNFWQDLSASLPFMQLFFMQSCLHFPKNSPALSHLLPLIDAIFRSAWLNSSWTQSLENFEIQFIIVLVAVASSTSASLGTLSSTICELPRESPLVLSMHRAMVGAAAVKRHSDTFITQALALYANIDGELENLPSDAIVLRSIFDRAKREAADSIISLCVSKETPESGQMVHSLLSVFNSPSGSYFPQLLSILSSLPSHILHRSLLPLVITMCKNLCMGKFMYSQDAVDFATFILCASSRGSFAASRRALKHIHSCISSVWTRPALSVVQLSRAALSSVDPSSASVLKMHFNDFAILSFANAGWAVVALGDRCARISVAAACVLCAALQNNGGSCCELSQISGIPECVISKCLQTLINLGLIQCIDAHEECVFVPTKLCAARQRADQFVPVLDSVHEPYLSLDCNFMDADFISIIQGILAILPRAAFISEDDLGVQCAKLTQAPPGKIAHVLSYLESKGLLRREGANIAMMSPHLESSAQNRVATCTNIEFQLPSCILQLVIAVPAFQEIFPFDLSFSSAVCVPRGDFEMFLGKSFSRILPLSGIDQLQLSSRFIESGACIATILFSLHGAGASAPQACSGGNFSVSKGFCPVCLEDDADLIGAACGHGACFVCWKGYITTALHDDSTQTVNQASEDRLHLTKLKCIADDSCDAPLSIDFLSQVSPSAASSMACALQKSMCRSILSVSPTIVHCQFCDFVIVAPNELCEAQCSNCGRIKAIGDFKRNSADQDWISHPNLKSGDLSTWQSMNQQGSIERFELMRFKKCPRCGAVTTRCGCEDGKVICDGLERCPNERCDQCCPPLPLPTPHPYPTTHKIVPQFCA